MGGTSPGRYVQISTPASVGWTETSQFSLLPVWAKLARDFEAAHPGVRINITPLENEAFCFSTTSAFQATFAAANRLLKINLKDASDDGCGVLCSDPWCRRTGV